MGIGKDNEPFALILGLIGLIAGGVFFLYKFNVIELGYGYDETFLWSFAVFTLLSGLIHLLTTFGVVGKKF